jgi:hypothetical protein
VSNLAVQAAIQVGVPTVKLNAAREPLLAPEGPRCPRPATSAIAGFMTHRRPCKVAPALLDEQGVGPITASALLVSGGDNPQRLRLEESFAHLCGAAPLDASSGKQQRHRLNRGGDRQANCALHTIAVVRMSHDETTRTYIARRIADGKTKREAIRCLERYIARDIHRILVPVITPESALDKTKEHRRTATGGRRPQVSGPLSPDGLPRRGEPRGEWPRRVASTVHRPFPSWREARPQPPLPGAPGRFVEGGPREAPPLG